MCINDNHPEVTQCNVQYQNCKLFLKIFFKSVRKFNYFEKIHFNKSLSVCLFVSLFVFCLKKESGKNETLIF